MAAGWGATCCSWWSSSNPGLSPPGDPVPCPRPTRRARDYLAAKVSLPPLGQYGLPPEQLQKIEAERKLEVRVGEALTALAEFYHRRLKEAPKVLEWLHAHYGISDDTIESLQIGFAANGACKETGKEYKGVLSALTKRKDPFTLRELGRHRRL